MAEDYSSTGGMYEDAPDTPVPAPEEPAETPVDEEAPKGDEPKTALLPRSLFGTKDLAPGKRCQVEIVSVLEDEVQVKYVSHDSKKRSGMEEMME